jgi:hypothetical protein
MSRHVRVYAALLRLYPRRFRAAYRREMALVFAQQLQDARSNSALGGVLRLWTRTLFDLVATAPSEHFEDDVLVTQPVTGSDRSRTSRGSPRRVAWMIVALAPAFMLLLVSAFGPQFMDPMFQKPPEMLGLPMGTAITGICLVWDAIGVALMGRASTDRVRLAVMLVFVFPALFGILLGPSVILILQNLST